MTLQFNRIQLMSFNQTHPQNYCTVNIRLNELIQQTASSARILIQHNIEPQRIYNVLNEKKARSIQTYNGIKFSKFGCYAFHSIETVFYALLHCSYVVLLYRYSLNVAFDVLVIEPQMGKNQTYQTRPKQQQNQIRNML